MTDTPGAHGFVSCQWWATPLVAAALLGACGGEDSLEPKLSVIEREVFAKSCAFSSCHDEPGSAGLVLRPGKAHGKLVNVRAWNPAAASERLRRVVSGKPERSFLVKKLQSGLDSKFGAVMPKGTDDGLDQPRLDAIIAWIARGAPND